MLPLSFQEFIDFHGFTIKETINALGNKKRYVYDSIKCTLCQGQLNKKVYF